MTTTTTAVKTCSRCGLTKPVAAFSPDKRASDGRQSRCRECEAQRTRTRGLQLQPVPQPDYSVLRYDYAAIDAAHRQTVMDAALDILAHGRRAKESIVAMGQRLIEVKAMLPDGTFTAWIDKEFGLSDRMAQNFMNVARQYGERPEIISVLNDTVLYLLSAPSTPDAARAEVEAIAVTEGKSPKVAQAQRIVKAHKPHPEGRIVPLDEVVLEDEPTEEPADEELAAMADVAAERKQEEQERLDIEVELDVADQVLAAYEAGYQDAIKAATAPAPEPMTFDAWLAAMPPLTDLRQHVAILELGKTTAKATLDMPHIRRQPALQRLIYNTVYNALGTWSALIKELGKVGKP